MEIIMSAPHRGMVLTVLISTRQYPVVYVGPLIHIRYLWARYKFISLTIQLNVQILRKYWSRMCTIVWWSTEVMIQAEVRRIIFCWTCPSDSSSVESLSVYLSQVVHVSWTGRWSSLVCYQCYSNHNSLYQGYASCSSYIYVFLCILTMSPTDGPDRALVLTT